ncbi:DUF2332 domain-containing protein [Brevibacterium litoralis]|uniref:DUF2332 domain-containing protein n=1 Tax=Brevibacterium litoralis TaxID=3138935 RepID=UPI0032ED1F11
MDPVTTSQDAAVPNAAPQSTAQRVAARYGRFARYDVAGYSPVYEAWARAVEDTPEVAARIAGLPEAKRQPNLVFAAVRVVGGDGDRSTASSLDTGFFLDTVRNHWDAVERIVRTRSTQTNEAARCGVLLPFLARIARQEDRPLALLEVGHSAGVCLHPDQYAYRYSVAGRTPAAGPISPVPGPSKRPDGPSRVHLTTDLRGDLRGLPPVPASVPEIAWRGGIDLNPLDPTDPDDRAWLRTLVWPEHTDRRRRLDAALDVAAVGIDTGQVDVRTGDLLEELPAMLQRIPDGIVPVVLHSAVLAYVPGDRRAAFVDDMRTRVAAGELHWISNEGVKVVDHPGRPDLVTPEFLLAVDGVPQAFAHQHGAYLRSLS